jgi:hypothetical protein
LGSIKAQKKEEVFIVVFFGKIFPKNTTCGASHQLHVGNPVIGIHRSGSSEAAASPVQDNEEQL